ncbi:MAG: sulfurtransferase [Cyanobacteriota bacterium]|nr:sulfurtransferase [Cyanobacteriota bacterium]
MTNYAHPEVLVDTQWLCEHLDDPNVRIVEVNMSPEAYQDARIPGAVFWNVFTDVLQPDHRMNLDPGAIEKLLSRSGIGNETTVVAYGSYPGTGAWIFWLLKFFGHRDVRVLNGGHQAWVARGCPVTSEFSSFPPTEYRTQPIDSSLRVLFEDVRASLGDPERVLLDVRSLPEYRGEQYLMKPPEPEERAGHIPGSVHLEHTCTLNEDGTFKSFDQLQALFEEQGIAPEKTVFPYCAIGARAGYIWFVLKYLLGYPNVQNYDGSWNEWSRLPDAPIEQ